MDAPATHDVGEKYRKVNKNWDNLVILGSGNHLGIKEIEQPNYHRGQYIGDNIH